MRVGKRMYSVEVVEALIDKNCMGRVNYQNRNIQIATHHSPGRKIAGADIRDSFWHETIHAILHDMGRDNLNRDEAFVRGLASRLSHAIDTARF
jgi:hypothetical protein